MTKHITPHWKSLLDEFELDWRLAGLAPKTATEYVRHLHSFLTLFSEPTAMNAKQWLEHCPTAPNMRYKARALRRFAKWLDALPGELGVRTARYADDRPEHAETPYAANRAKLLDALRDKNCVSEFLGRWEPPERARRRNDA